MRAILKKLLTNSYSENTTEIFIRIQAEDIAIEGNKASFLVSKPWDGLGIRMANHPSIAGLIYHNFFTWPSDKS